MTIDPNILDRYWWLRRSWLNTISPRETMRLARLWCDHHVFGTKTVRYFGLLVGRTDHDPGDEDRS